MFLSIGRVDGPGTSVDAGFGPSPFLAERWGVASIASGVAGALVGESDARTVHEPRSSSFAKIPLAIAPPY